MAIGNAVLTAVPGVGTAVQVIDKVPVLGSVTSAVEGAIDSVAAKITGLFGTGDTSPFQDARIDQLAQLWLQGNTWAGQWLAGETGRYGAVRVDGGRAAHVAALGSAADVVNWATKGASNWNGDDGGAGPTVHVGSQDRGWTALQYIAQQLGVQLPPPNSFQTNSPGNVRNGSPAQFTVFAPTTAALTPATIAAGLVTGGKIAGIPSWVWLGLLLLSIAISLHYARKRAA